VSDTTTIEWTRNDDGTPGRTWNPFTGCTKISPGCDNCYAETIAERFRGSDAFPVGFDLQLRSPQTMNAPLTWRKPTRVFVNSMSDVFHDGIHDQDIIWMFAVMVHARRHTFQLLTKRHGRMRSLLNSPSFEHMVRHRAEVALGPLTEKWQWPLPNLWLGVSVENQKWADIRIPALLETPAAVRFLSCEPLLGPIDLCGPIVPGRGRPKLTYWLDGRPGWGPDQTDDRGRVFQELTVGPRIDWVIVGGESGRRARPMHPNWARSLRDQCAAADVPYFFKQWGEWGPAPFRVPVCDPDVGWTGTDAELAAAKTDSEARGATHVHTGQAHEDKGERVYWIHEIGHKPWSLERVGLPDNLAAIRRWGKTKAGRELDGRTHDAFPRPR
jgi:protein gp37